MTAAPPAPTTDAAKGPVTGRLDPQADPAELAAGMANVRSLLQRTGAGLGAAGTAIVAGLGYTQLHQFFPIPQSISWVWSALAVVALIFAVSGSAWLAGIFLGAQRQILIGTRDEDTIDLDKGEQKLVGRMLVEPGRSPLATSAHSKAARCGWTGSPPA